MFGYVIARLTAFLDERIYIPRIIFFWMHGAALAYLSGQHGIDCLVVCNVTRGRGHRIRGCVVFEGDPLEFAS